MGARRDFRARPVGIDAVGTCDDNVRFVICREEDLGNRTSRREYGNEISFRFNGSRRPFSSVGWLHERTGDSAERAAICTGDNGRER
jgi:hypothetical protein